jgi:hypothetical protein
MIKEKALEAYDQYLTQQIKERVEKSAALRERALASWQKLTGQIPEIVQTSSSHVDVYDDGSVFRYSEYNEAVQEGFWMIRKYTHIHGEDCKQINVSNSVFGDRRLQTLVEFGQLFSDIHDYIEENYFQTSAS